ncbi:nicotinate-nucleotide--dimethylbenzimidazole phosphoribosyltransferase [Streptomyces europaeiscabiei]|uniref:nicotinate-nucleotide--dimethylbenzimidazole phosphoribosyltransferase n=1 Tax=Streptomyces europaeiscabiei TaxID=146819 RepID=UPI0029AD3D63|nr:nicotinate-nucleotide--dimethylbenzimidazole phosphoribosyltransferase [Streptomyces europaeiscabiei]MDX3711944.1 nicotinate-nucleotide--dimethylbenzimidazole phosphoribosyltransferase [Streptomyces europaeiscabiei]MDX3863871.1 nicotinate-nucleotide--dimethylbenzimidazole phosphoribosyltransferase [Streptomyces europaeiscabiei]MDX3870215.1 nicotinate-nucleotide--dimethylbenzimidazole phosphoribosyltransferase [Streptomyces europaeiscabiei]
MTDTGQVPGEGLPESAGMVEQPGVPAPGAYTYLSETTTETTTEDEDLLLPGAQGAWGNEMPPPAPEPVVQVVHEPGPHEMSGRDSGSLDLGAVRTPVATPVPQPPVARRPLHLGPPTPDASASPVRSLADRGPAGAPAPPGAVRHSGPATVGPEYLDVPQQPVSQWVGAPATAAPAVAVGGAAAETVAPQEARLSVAVAETSPAVESPQAADTAEEIQDAEALHQAQDAAYALAQEAAAAQFRTPEAVGTPVAAQFQAPDAPEDAEAPTAVQTEVPEAVEAQAHVPVAVEEPAAVEARPLEPAEAPAVVQAQVPEAVEATVVGRTPAPEEAVEPSAPEAAEIAAVVETPQTDVPQGPEPVATAPEAQTFEEAEPVTPAAQAPDTTPFPPAAQGPEPVPAQTVAEAPDAPQLPQEPEEVLEVLEDLDASVPGQLTEADALPQADSAAAAPAQADEAAAEDAEQAVTPEQQAPPAAADEQADPGVPDARLATAAPDEESALASPEEPTADAVPDTAQDAALTQDPQQSAETPVAEEPQHTEVGAAEAEPSQAPAEAAQSEAAQPEVVTEEHQPPSPAQPEPSAVQGPQSTEPVALVADQDQDHNGDHNEAVVAQPAETAPEPEPAQPPVPEAVVEPEATDVNAADQPADSAETQETAAADQSTGEAPTDPSEPAADLTTEELTTEELTTEELTTEDPATEDPATGDPSAAEPFTVEAPLLVASQIDAPQGAVVQPPTEPAPDAPLAGALQEPAPQADADLPLGRFVPVDGSVPTAPHPAPTPPHAMVVPPLPADDLATPVVTEFPAAEGQAQAAESAPGPQAQATVPTPRDPEAETIVVPQPLAAADAHPDVVQSAEDLDTRAADQEDGEAAAPEAEAVETAAAEESAAPVEEAPEDVREEVREEVRKPAGPAAPPYDDAEREAVLKVMRERRDIRNGFRDDPIPHDVLLRVLEAAHTAPSVGHSQPWDFVVIRSAETRRTMHELAQRQREAYAKSLPKGRAKQFKELKIEAILDTPVNIVVTADPTRGGRHTLGRHTQPQMAPYSSALAVENLWLAARAEGLGVGWVSFFDEREMVRALGLPDHLEVVAYLCVGYVDEFPEEPELMQAGWAKRRPLSWVVHEETYGRRALPGAEPHDLLAETVAGIRPLDAKALGEAWERQKRMTKPAGALGMLEIISAQLAGLSRQCPPPIPEPAAVAIFAGDHGVHAQGVTPWPQEVTAQMVANFLGGGAVCNAFATQVGAEVCVVDVGVASDLPATPGLLPRKIRAGTSDMTTGPAMTREEAKQAIEVGIETARDLVAAGNKALLTGEMGIANTTASAALIAVFTGADPSEVTGRGTGINDETLARKTEVVRRAIELHQPDPADPIGVLAAIGGFEHAAIVGLLLGGASLRTPVILDGVSAGAAALVARAIAPEVLAACIAGHRSAEPGHVAALQKLGLRPLVDLDLRLGEGTGALLALPVVQSAARAMHEVATFDSAGVTEK